MNEENTRAELIEPLLEQAGWGRNFPLTKIDRAFTITLGKLQRGGRAQHLFADFILIYKNVKLAVIESKSIVLEVGEGVAQAKNYAQKMQLDYAFACNGTEIYKIFSQYEDVFQVKAVILENNFPYHIPNFF